MAFAPDDHVIVDDNAQQASGLGNPAGDRDVGAAGFGRAGGVVVDNPTAFAIVLIFLYFLYGRLKVVPGLGSGV